ncbi:uncharacterized protein LOC131928043 [Physella acuta]|uniref:uncharacterized protein LOC131928043 n=1 Tax=Physella acuta TaxID=109671 RepID=UPI0027DC4870|nr:uncharacterized protein LOC131928043 [Physella acuta]
MRHGWVVFNDEMNCKLWDPCLVGQRFTPARRSSRFGSVPIVRCINTGKGIVCVSMDPPKRKKPPTSPSREPKKPFSPRVEQTVTMKAPSLCETHILDHMRCNCIACMNFACKWRNAMKEQFRNHFREPNAVSPKPHRWTPGIARASPEKVVMPCPAKNITLDESAMRRGRTLKKVRSPKVSWWFGNYASEPEVPEFSPPETLRQNQKQCCKFFCTARKSCLKNGTAAYKPREEERPSLTSHPGDLTESQDGFEEVAMDGTLRDSRLKHSKRVSIDDLVLDSDLDDGAWPRGQSSPTTWQERYRRRHPPARSYGRCCTVGRQPASDDDNELGDVTTNSIAGSDQDFRPRKTDFRLRKTDFRQPDFRSMSRLHSDNFMDTFHMPNYSEYLSHKSKDRVRPYRTISEPKKFGKMTTLGDFGFDEHSENERPKLVDTSQDEDNFKDLGHRDKFKDLGHRDKFKDLGHRDKFKDLRHTDIFKDLGHREHFKDPGQCDNFKDLKHTDNSKDTGHRKNFKDLGPLDLEDLGHLDSFEDPGECDNFKDLGHRDQFEHDSPKKVGDVDQMYFTKTEARHPFKDELQGESKHRVDEFKSVPEVLGSPPCPSPPVKEKRVIRFSPDVYASEDDVTEWHEAQESWSSPRHRCDHHHHHDHHFGCRSDDAAFKKSKKKLNSSKNRKHLEHAAMLPEVKFKNAYRRSSSHSRERDIHHHHHEGSEMMHCRSHCRRHSDSFKHVPNYEDESNDNKSTGLGGRVFGFIKGMIGYGDTVEKTTTKPHVCKHHTGPHHCDTHSHTHPARGGGSGQMKDKHKTKRKRHRRSYHGNNNNQKFLDPAENDTKQKRPMLSATFHPVNSKRGRSLSYDDLMLAERKDSTETFYTRRSDSRISSHSRENKRCVSGTYAGGDGEISNRNQREKSEAIEICQASNDPVLIPNEKKNSESEKTGKKATNSDSFVSAGDKTPSTHTSRSRLAGEKIKTVYTTASPQKTVSPTTARANKNASSWMYVDDHQSSTGSSTHGSRPAGNCRPFCASERVLSDGRVWTEGEWLQKHTSLMTECSREQEANARARVQRLANQTHRLRQSMRTLSFDFGDIEKRLEKVRDLQQDYIVKSNRAVYDAQRHRGACREHNHNRTSDSDTEFGSRDSVTSRHDARANSRQENRCLDTRDASCCRYKKSNDCELKELYSYFLTSDARGNPHDVDHVRTRPLRQHKTRYPYTESVDSSTNNIHGLSSGRENSTHALKENNTYYGKEESEKDRKLENRKTPIYFGDSEMRNQGKEVCKNVEQPEITSHDFRLTDTNTDTKVGKSNHRRKTDDSTHRDLKIRTDQLTEVLKRNNLILRKLNLGIFAQPDKDTKNVCNLNRLGKLASIRGDCLV